MDGLNLGSILIWFVVFLLSLTVHECAHAWAAERSGDPTGRYLGRVTLNPIAHIDLFGTIIFPLIAITTSVGAWMFGWAKPVPFNPGNLRNRRRGEIVIALAGPMSNVLLVMIFVFIYKVAFQTSLIPQSLLGEYFQPLTEFLEIGISLNIILAVFNMIPIPPLDGHHVLRNLLPDSLAELYVQIPGWAGFVLLIVMVQLGLTRMLTMPVFNVVSWILE